MTELAINLLCCKPVELIPRLHIMESAKCETCNKEFSYYRSTLRGKTARFCSRACIKLTANSGSFKNQGKLTLNTCLGCGKNFKAYINKGTAGKFCSPDCYQENHDTIKNLGKYAEGVKGSDNPAWKGGVTPLHIAIRHSKEYSLWRNSVLEKDNYTCQMCFKRGGKLQADHIKPFALYPELRFAIDNGRTLCVECHRKTDTYGYRTTKLSRVEVLV